jgi:hypothetical protein
MCQSLGPCPRVVSLHNPVCYLCRIMSRVSQKRSGAGRVMFGASPRIVDG